MSFPVSVFFTRSLNESARQLRTYLIRGGLLLIFMASLAMVQATSVYYGAPGLHLFDSVLSLNLLLICLAAPGYFVSVITEEKEAGTLGLLKMAGLNPLSVLLGKSTSQLLAAVMLLLTQLPVTVLAVTLGGVALIQVFASYISMLAFLLFMGNLALLCSVVCRHTSRAATLCILSLLAFFLGPSVGQALLGALVSERVLARSGLVDRWLGGFFDLVTRASPFTWAREILSTGFSGPLAGFQVWSNLALSVGLFLLAWAVFNRFTREQATAGPPRGLLVRRIRGLGWLSAGRAWRDALIWKDFYFMAGGKVSLLARFVLVGLIPILILTFMSATGESMDRETVGGMIVGVALTVLFLELVVQSARIFGEERRWQTLSALMVLPLSPRRIMYHKAAGYALGLLPYVAWFLIGGFVTGHQFMETVGGMMKEVGFYLGLAYCLLFLHLIAYLSLILRRGAILLAFVIWFFGGQLLTPLVFLLGFGLRHPNLAIGLMLVVTVVLTLILQRRIVKRLARVAATE